MLRGIHRCALGGSEPTPILRSLALTGVPEGQDNDLSRDPTTLRHRRAEQVGGSDLAQMFSVGATTFGFKSGSVCTGW